MVAEFVESATETRSGFRAFETAHGSVSTLDPAMVLLDPIIQILVGAVLHAVVQFSPDRARITIVTVRRDTRGGDAGHGFGGAEKRLRRLHVAGLAQPDVDERTEPINRAIKVAPSAIHFDVRLVSVPASPNPATGHEEEEGTICPGFGPFTEDRGDRAIVEHLTGVKV